MCIRDSYNYMGCLNENNERETVRLGQPGTKTRYMTLGKNYPYVSMYNAKDSKEVCNFSIIIKSFDAVIGGEKYDKNLILGYHSSESSLRLLLDYDEIQIKEGDYIHMDYILLPFGDYNVESDKSVLNVREDTCINPLKVTADFGQAEEVYPVPTVSASKDGDFYKSIFTLSGARDSYTCLLYTSRCV